MASDVYCGFTSRSTRGNVTPLPGRYTPPPVPPPLPGPSPAPSPGPTPVPRPVPAPPPVPDPCDNVGGPGGASIAPGNDSVAAASGAAGITSCSTGFGSFFATCLGGSMLGGFATGTVILSLPGNSALRGGSFIWLPPPPPPPPGPGWLSQMIELGLTWVNTGSTGAACPPKRTRTYASKTTVTCPLNDVKNAGPSRF